MRAPVLEVFASIQGEGRFVGEPQAFVRLAGCPLRCRWCDTPGSWAVPAAPRARVRAGAAARRAAGWATPEDVRAWIEAVEAGPARTVSLTGGEPLAWPAFVRALRAELGPRRLHLETAGAHPRALAGVLAAVDHVSLDLKLPADLAPPEPLGLAGDGEGEPHGAAAWAAVRAEVLTLVRGRDACAKLIVAGDRAAAEFLPLLEDVARLAPELPLVLQPVTPVNGVPAPSAALLEELVNAALARGLELRVVPQIHRQLGLP
ncbi:MAG TPA: 7-carboxy-7-deazaguanine synthase QueE [Planctomycetota bacterium]